MHTFSPMCDFEEMKIKSIIQHVLSLYTAGDEMRNERFKKNLPLTVPLTLIIRKHVSEKLLRGMKQLASHTKTDH